MASFEIQESGDVEMEIVEHSTTHVEETQEVPAVRVEIAEIKRVKIRTEKVGVFYLFFSKIGGQSARSESALSKKKKTRKNSGS